MQIKRYLVYNKRRQALFFGLFLFLGLISLAFSITEEDDFTLAKREILLRRIGHEILLQSGDSVSRVLPVKRISDHEYQLRFEQPFGFQPEQLVNITQKLLTKAPQTSDYVVQVLRCDKPDVVYGFAFSNNKQDELISCLGRKQPKACYLIQIKFPNAGPITTTNGLLLGSLAFLAVVGYVIWKPAKEQVSDLDNNLTQPINQFAPTQAREAGQFVLGTILFNLETRTLTHQETSIELTKTEARVLHMFALAPNSIIERSRLQKEIWEDEGVIVGRSLDVFISKLRKKLELDPNIRISVIRGKGYQLEIGG